MSPRGAEDMDAARKVKAMRKDQQVIKYDKEALRVVIPITDEPAAQVKFYVMIDGNDLFCQTRKIHNSYVFYGFYTSDSYSRQQIWQQLSSNGTPKQERGSGNAQQHTNQIRSDLTIKSRYGHTNRSPSTSWR